ncbi:MAG: aminotransferase class V-fold PLP-dependent enzyme [Planctomycetota bacterium]
MRIYLDNAATSWPKPDAVYAAMDRYQRELGAAAGRGSYQSSVEAQRIVSETRASCARLLGVGDARQLIFTANGTSALNLAIHGLLRPGDHVVTTVCEHNSVLRPLSWQSEQSNVAVTHVGCNSAGLVDPAAIADAITPSTKLVAITHASNVTGAIQPVEEVAKIAHSANALILVDAAQTAGCVPIDAVALDIDLLACGGHKGLLGPLGTGLLYIRAGLEQQISAITQGGTGSDSLPTTQPAQLPEKFEAGNLNVPAIAGLGAAIQWIEQRTVENIHEHHHELACRLIERLDPLTNVKIVGPTTEQPRLGVVSCSIDGYDPQEFATAVDLIGGVECRAGLHCAPKMHAALGTDTSGGLVRFSPGWSTTIDDVDSAVAAIAAVAENVPT